MLEIAAIGSFLFLSLGAAALAPGLNPAPFVEVRFFHVDVFGSFSCSFCLTSKR